MIFELAKQSDLSEIARLLETSELPATDLDFPVAEFIVAKEQNRIVGCIGFEKEGPLLRSLAVDPSYRDRGIAKILCEKLFQHAKKQGAGELYLLTTTAAGFFDRLGFYRKNRNEAPESIRINRQFTELCPGTAVLMWKSI